MNELKQFEADVWDIYNRVYKEWCKPGLIIPQKVLLRLNALTRLALSIRAYENTGFVDLNILLADASQ